MNKLFISTLLFFVFLTSCSADTRNDAGIKQSSTPSAREDLTDNAGPITLDSSGISSINIKDLMYANQGTDQDADQDTDQGMEYANPGLIGEFCSFLTNQHYSEAKEEWDKSYRAQLFDKDKKMVLEVTFGARAVTFDRDIAFGAAVFKKGTTYETGQWVSDYLKNLYEGAVLDPANIKYPASVEIPGDAYLAEMIDKGDSRINRYDTYPQLYDFVQGSFLGCEFKITGSRKFYDYESMDAEALKIKNSQQCLLITFSSSETYLDIRSMNGYKELSKVYILVLSKDPQKVDTYTVISDGMAFDIQVRDDFDSKFGALFSGNARTQKYITPDEIETLFAANKPYFMEYVCKNLGIEGWNGRPPDQVERRQMKLDNGSSPYTVLSIYNPFDVRLLIFKKNSNKTMQFVDYIDFGGRTAGTEYKLEKAGDKVWVTGKRCRGYGTGEARYYKEWYAVSDEGSKLVLSFPDDEYMEPPWGGYTLHADDISITRSGIAKISVNYSISKRYLLDLDLADEYGIVEVEGKKNVVFQWDETKAAFVSEYAPDDRGVTVIPPENGEITRKCDALLEKYYDRLLENIKALPGEQEDMRRGWKATALRNFLNDCPDSDKKAELNRQLT